MSHIHDARSPWLVGPTKDRYSDCGLMLCADITLAGAAPPHRLDEEIQLLHGTGAPGLLQIDPGVAQGGDWCVVTVAILEG